MCGVQLHFYLSFLPSMCIYEIVFFLNIEKNVWCSLQICATTIILSCVPTVFESVNQRLKKVLYRIRISGGEKIVKNIRKASQLLHEAFSYGHRETYKEELNCCCANEFGDFKNGQCMLPQLKIIFLMTKNRHKLLFNARESTREALKN